MGAKGMRSGSGSGEGRGQHLPHPLLPEGDHAPRHGTGGQGGDNPVGESAVTRYTEFTKGAFIYIYAWGERALTESEVQAELAWERFVEAPREALDSSLYSDFRLFRDEHYEWRFVRKGTVLNNESEDPPLIAD